MLTSLPNDLPVRRLPAPKTTTPSCLALAGSTIAVAAGATLVLLDATTGTERNRTELPWPADELGVSESGRFVAAGARPPRTELLVLDAESGATTLIPKLPGHWLAGFGFAGDQLLISRDQRSLTTYDPAGSGELAHIDTAGVEPDAIVPLGDGRVCVVGHHEGERRDVLVVLPPDPTPAAFHDELDLAYRLAGGPAPDDALVAFRDPEDMEEPDEDDDEENVDRHELYGFKGLYVRSLATRAVLARIEWDGPVHSGDGCVATPACIAVAMRGDLALVDRGGGGESRIPAAATGVDPLGRRAVAADAGGDLVVIDLP